MRFALVLYFARLANVDRLTVGRGIAKPKASAAVVVGTTSGSHEVFVPLAGMIDLADERDRLNKAIEEKQKFLTSVERKLANEQFTSRAPADVVERERQKVADASSEIAKLRANLDDLL